MQCYPFVSKDPAPSLCRTYRSKTEAKESIEDRLDCEEIMPPHQQHEDENPGDKRTLMTRKGASVSSHHHHHRLLEPQPWGEFATAQEKYVGLMTPPLEVLRAAYEASEPTEIAYVIVLPGGKKSRRPKAVLAEEDDEDDDDRAPAPSYLRNDPTVPVQFIKENKKMRHLARSVCGASAVTGYTARTLMKPRYRLILDGEEVKDSVGGSENGHHQGPVDLLSAPPLTIEVKKSKKKKQAKNEIVESQFQTPSKHISKETSWDHTEATTDTETTVDQESPRSSHRALFPLDSAPSPQFTPIAKSIQGSSPPVVPEEYADHNSQSDASVATPGPSPPKVENNTEKIATGSSAFKAVVLRATNKEPTKKKQLSPKETNELKEIFSSLKNRDVGELLEKLVDTERKESKLHMQLTQSGVAVAEDIPYQVAKDKINEIAQRMNEIGGNDVTHPDKAEQARLREEYFKLEQEMEKYNAALMFTDEYQAELEAEEKKWEEIHAEDNSLALKALRRHMPVDVRKLSSDELVALETPNGKKLPLTLIRKFKRTNVLQLLRVSPDDIERMHPSTLEMLRVTGLTLTERRALYVHLTGVGQKWKSRKEDKMVERKWQWYNMMKGNFKENLDSYERHVHMYGPPGNHPYKSNDCPSGCPMLGKQCPLKADAMFDYFGDYGFGEEARFEESNIHKTGNSEDTADNDEGRHEREAEKDRLAALRVNELKEHYGKILQVSKANGSCEAMDELIESIDSSLRTWVEMFMTRGFDHKRVIQGFSDRLNEIKIATTSLAQRAGVKTSGARIASDEEDIRSLLEVELSEEVYDRVVELFNFIENRMPNLVGSDNRVFSTISMLDPLWEEIHERNEKMLRSRNIGEPRKTRLFVSVEDMEAELTVAKTISGEAAPLASHPSEASGDSSSRSSRTVRSQSPVVSNSVQERTPPGLLAAIAAKGKSIQGSQ